MLEIQYERRYIVFMSRTVRISIIEKWLNENGPLPVERLAMRAGVSASLISKVRLGNEPKKTRTRQKLAEALGVTEDELFPLVAAKSA